MARRACSLLASCGGFPPFARVTGRRDEPCVGSEPVGALKGAHVAHGHQKLGPEDRSHAWQASEDPSLGAGEKTLFNLLIDALDALLEAEDIFSEFCDDARGYLLCGERDILRGGRDQSFIDRKSTRLNSSHANIS